MRSLIRKLIQICPAGVDVAMMDFEGVEGKVIITCRKPDSFGNMEVTMEWEGDPVLAAYLVETAGEFTDEILAGEDGNDDD